MNKTYQKINKSVVYNEDNHKHRFTATAEIEQLGNQSPYFAMTGEDWIIGQRECWCCGMMHDEIRKRFPEWEKYLKWHLTSTDTGPLHYVANALYWAGHSGWCDGKPNSPPNKEYLYSTIVYGALESDFNYTPEDMSEDELKDWLISRLNPLLDVFAKDMNELFRDGTLSYSERS